MRRGAFGSSATEHLPEPVGTSFRSRPGSSIGRRAAAGGDQVAGAGRAPCARTDSRGEGRDQTGSAFFLKAPSTLPWRCGAAVPWLCSGPSSSR
jgi:hypothetical protein